jgi:hypothetical protein
VLVAVIGGLLFGYEHNREEVEFTAFFCIIHDIND